MFQHIALLGAYVKIEQWSVSKMNPPYDICFPTLIQVIYYKDKVCYFNNKNVISIITIGWFPSCSSSPQHNEHEVQL
jgi:hypothetical protein